MRVYAVSTQTNDMIDEKLQKRYTVKLGVRLQHKFNIDSELLLCRETSNANQALPRLRMKLLSPKARKLIKQTSLIIQRANSSSLKSSNETEQNADSEIEVDSLKVSFVAFLNDFKMRLFFDSRVLQSSYKNLSFGPKEK